VGVLLPRFAAAFMADMRHRQHLDAGRVVDPRR